MSVCEEHSKLMVSVARIEEQLKAQNKQLDEALKFINNHIKESVPVRDNVRKHDATLKGYAKFLWIVGGGVVINFIRTIGVK